MDIPVVCFKLIFKHVPHIDCHIPFNTLFVEILQYD